jgi:hypothetical protein
MTGDLVHQKRTYVCQFGNNIIRHNGCRNKTDAMSRSRISITARQSRRFSKSSGAIFLRIHM